MARLLVRRGDEAGLTRRADTGDPQAAGYLGELLVKRGDEIGLTRWAEIGKDRERKLRQQRRTDAWLRKQAGADERRSQVQGVAQAKSTKAEQARQAWEDGLAEVQARGTALAEELAGFVGVLSAVVALEPRTLGWFAPTLRRWSSSRLVRGRLGGGRCGPTSRRRSPVCSGGGVTSGR